MTRRERILRRLLVEHRTPAGLAERDPAWTGGKELAQLSERKLEAIAREIFKRGVSCRALDAQVED
jgi:hypothetical protein